MNSLPTKEQIREYLISNIINEMVRYLIDEESLSLEQAMDVVYRSNTIQLLQMPEGELYVQSPAYVYEMMKQEICKDTASHFLSFKTK
ncbi:MAG: hypothetical protein KBS94_02815 [Prevotella sp.]|nr:hypothetical protein [Candidatus Equicola faecalis]